MRYYILVARSNVRRSFNMPLMSGILNFRYKTSNKTNFIFKIAVFRKYLDETCML